MKIEIITDRQPFVNGKPTQMGETFDVDDATGQAMIGNGFAIEIVKKRGRAKAND